MDKKQAVAILYGDGSTSHDRMKYPLEDRLQAHAVYLRRPGYNVPSAIAAHQNEVLADMCEAITALYNKGKGISYG